MRRLETALQIHFALLSALGGVMLGMDNAAGPLPVIAVVSSLFSLVAVDLLKWFSLPPAAAYLGMAGVAAYCISDFLLIDPQNNQQLIAVAQLLVLVLAVLQMQRKTRRVFEQIGIFCLLELVVAAVFNNALIFAAMMVPFAVLGISGLVLLQAAAVAEPASPLASSGLSEAATPGHRDHGIQTQSPATVADVVSQGLRLPRLSLATLGPSIVLVAAIFFYALPRTTESASGGIHGGPPAVGFSESLSLQQLGRMLQNPTPVLHVRLFDRKTQNAYRCHEALYLRGTVLDLYELAGNSGVWRCMPVGKDRQAHPLPAAPRIVRRRDRQFFDTVDVEITAQPLSTQALFAIAPYHAVESNPDVLHTVGNWVLSRGGPTALVEHRRITYRFGTNAFQSGSATRYLRALGPRENLLLMPRVISAEPGRWQPLWIGRLTRFDPECMPTVQQMADAVVAAMPDGKRNPHDICMRMESYLQRDSGLRYSLDLSHDRDPSLDPLEQFLTVDRAGHCQYFATALAMMLRSQGIPTRIVVGYKCDEYNALGQHYVVRQSHAHAWVEALLDSHELPERTVLHGQPDRGPVWIRLDPTPRSFDEGPSAARQVAHAVDFAQTVWERYVVDMDSEQQKTSLFGDTGLSRLASSYARTLAMARRLVFQIDVDRLRPGSWFHGMPLAWATALGGVLGTLGLWGLWTLFRLRWPVPAHPLGARPATSVAAHPPQVDFFADIYDQLARVGLLRGAAQTPTEFAADAAERLRDPAVPAVDSPLQFLTDAYYRIRFGAPTRQVVPEEPIRQAVDQLTHAVDLFSTKQSRSR